MRAEVEHRYGRAVHILDDAYLLSLLAKLGHPDTPAPAVRALLRRVYERLLAEVAAHELPATEAEVTTRMRARNEHGVYRGRVLDTRTKIVIACIARAGVLPAETCFDLLADLVDPANLRLDYLAMSRRTDAAGRVIGAEEAGHKIGGPIRDAFLLIPDPMGATGGTVARTLELYRELGLGPAYRVLAMPMIATPEFVRRVTTLDDAITVWTARLDRGLSPKSALAALPGADPSERGLDDSHYIVPGAGGIGELLTNSWV